MEALAQNTYTMEKTLRERVIEILKELKMNKAELALRMNFSRSAVSQYLNGKYNSNPEALEEKLTEFVKEYEEHVKSETEEVSRVLFHLMEKEQIPRPVEVLQKVQLLMDRQLLQEFHLKLKQPVMC